MALPKCVLERLEPRVLLSAGLTAAVSEPLMAGADAPSAPLGATAIEVGLNPADPAGSTLQQASVLSAGAGTVSGQVAEPDILKLPLAFETNEGQTDPVVDFLARGSGYTVFLTDGDAVLRLDGNDGSYAVRIDLLGAADDPEAAGLDLLPGRSNYFLGNDPTQWYTDIPNYGSVEYAGVYDGVNVRYYGNQRQLEYDFLVAAGADPSVIRLAFAGVESVHVDESGGLVLQLSADGGQIRFDAPVSYQQTEGGQREVVASRYVIAADGTVGFEVGPYDTSRPLVIDPVLDYGTYLGGTGNDRGQVIKVDDSGNIYIAGRTSSADFPFTTDAVDLTHNGNTDAFIVQLSPDGGTLLYSTFLGGSGDDQIFDIQVGSSGVIYVAGETMSSDFPTKSGAYGSTLSGASDGFVAKINPGQSNLIYSTFVGGDQDDACLALAVDAGGRAYVTGTTTSSSGFPITAGAWQSSLNGSSDLFLVGLSPSAAQLDYGTYLGGSGTAAERGNSIVMDGAGHVYLTGATGAGDFPTTPGAYDTTFNGDMDAFLVEFDLTTSSLVYSTYLGGAGADEARGIFRDGSGRIYLVGDTTSVAFPTTPGAYDETYNGATDAFVVSFNAAYSLAYATYFGGTGIDYGNAIVADATGRAHLVGQTWSVDLPTTADAHQSVRRGPADAYVVVLDAAGATLVYATYLGGWGIDAGTSIVLDSAANIYVTGYDDTGGLATTPGAYDETHNGGEDTFVARFTAAGSQNNAPSVDLDANDSSGAGGADFATIFREGLGPVAVADVDALVSDLDSVNLVRLTVTITNLRDGAAESLSADTTGTSILASYDSATGVLTLSGVDTLAHYQQVLRTIRYNNTSANPDTTARIIRFVANDGAADSNVATATVTVVAQNNAPSLDLDADNSSGAGGADFATIFREGLGPVAIAGVDALLSDLDSVNLVRLTVTITNLRDGAAESLSADTTGTSILASYDSATGVLILSGADTVAHYQQVLRTIRYNNTSANPDTTARIIRFVANDGSSDSNVAVATLTVVARNDAPTLADVEGTPLPFTENDPAAPITGAIIVGDVDDTRIESATVRITGNYRNGEDVLDFVDTATITGRWDAATGTLTLTGSDSVAGYQAALRSITYRNASENPGTTTRTVTLTVNDGTDNSNSVTRSVTIIAVNDAPIINDQLFEVIAWGTPGTVVGVIAATDPDSAVAAYRITAGNTNGDLAVDPATGTITLNRGGDLAGGTETLVMEVEVTDDGTPSLSRTAVITVVVNFLPGDVIPPVPDEGDSGDGDPGDDAGGDDPTDDTGAETSPSETPTPASEPGKEVGPVRRPNAPRGTRVDDLPALANVVLPGATAGVPVLKVVQVSVTAPVVNLTEARWTEEAPAVTLTRRAERLLPQLGTFIGEFHAQILRKGRIQHVRIGVTAAVAGTVSVGYVIWLLRGGALLTAVLSSLPAWRFVDPLPVLDAWASGRKRQGRGQGTAGQDEDETEQRVQSILE